MGAGENGNNQWEWEGNNTRLNLGSGMGIIINHWKWEGMGLKKTFPLTSTLKAGQGHVGVHSAVFANCAYH